MAGAFVFAGPGKRAGVLCSEHRFPLAGTIAHCTQKMLTAHELCTLCELSTAQKPVGPDGFRYTRVVRYESTTAHSLQT